MQETSQFKQSSSGCAIHAYVYDYVYVERERKDREAQREREMTKESVRNCSHCGQNGHDSRTCNNGKGCSFKLFGVMIGPHNHNNNNGCGKDDEFQFIKKSKSMGNLQAACNNNKFVDHGYLSDGLLHCKSAQERKKGTSWTEDEHRSFLAGLQKLGKGDWRGISKNYVPTRTPTQVASHAQKYYIRITKDRRKRRSSVFDMHIPLMQALCTSPVSMKNSGSIGEQASASISPPGATCVRPPLSPVPRSFGVSTFCPAPYVEYPRSGDSFLAAIYADPSFLQVQNCHPSQAYIYSASVGIQPFARCASLSSPSAVSSLLPQPLPFVPMQTALTTSVTKKEGLATGIGALSL